MQQKIVSPGKQTTEIARYLAAIAEQRWKTLTADKFKSLQKSAFWYAKQILTELGYSWDKKTLQDVNSETWLTILAGRHEHVNGRFIANKMVWLYIDNERRRKAEKGWFLEFHHREMGKKDTRERTRSTIADLAEGLPADVSNVMHLKLDGFTYDEIAERMNISKRTVNYKVKEFEQEAKRVYSLSDVQDVC